MTPIRPDIEGIDAENVFTLRTIEDMNGIKKAAKRAKNIVCVGSSFIASECLSSFATKYKSKKTLSLIIPDEVPFEPLLGK